MTSIAQPQQAQLLGMKEAMKKVLKFSTPIICGALVNIIPTIVSIWFLSQLGKDYLAAAGLASPTFFTVVTVFLMVFYSVGIKVGHAYGDDPQSPVICQHFSRQTAMG